MKEAKIKDLKRRLGDLKRLMEAEGINAAAMLDKVGLSDDLVFSSAANNSQISEVAPVNGMVTSLTAGKKSGVSRESRESRESFDDTGFDRSNVQRKSVAFADQAVATSAQTASSDGQSSPEQSLSSGTPMAPGDDSELSNGTPGPSVEDKPSGTPTPSGEDKEGFVAERLDI